MLTTRCEGQARGPEAPLGALAGFIPAVFFLEINNSLMIKAL
jgi:hypothetical protein